MYQVRSVLWIRSLKHQNPCRRSLNIPRDFSSVNQSTKFSRFKNITKPNVDEFGALSDAPLPYRSLIKPTVFTVLFSTASFTAATIWQYENMRERAQVIISSPKSWFLDKLEPSNLWIQKQFGANSALKRGSFRQMINVWWNALSEGEKVWVPIAFANFLVYAAWKVPRWQGFMVRYFCSNPAGKEVWPMFLSAFSHCSLVHMGVNLFVLNSFMPNVVNSLGKEQFLAFYCSAGVFSSLLSYASKVALVSNTVSLGASGAIMAVLSYTCSKHPETLLSIVFLPFIVFKAGLGLKMIMGLDLTGLLLRWRTFDHAAHLGGALFGLFWCHYGSTLIWQKRGPILQYWHELRNKKNE
ncbi:presenilin-associated rhomboid-like protein, mitochondrial [Planococcus citri]|uniref:presenilin-associated rhomboid-like protein, mitochondrial n=1 Tax=Planococcus citri TaxID=170843 RepID=UPI0031FA103D